MGICERNRSTNMIPTVKTAEEFGSLACGTPTIHWADDICDRKRSKNMILVVETAERI
jgi:hypothetical protein